MFVYVPPLASLCNMSETKQIMKNLKVEAGSKESNHNFRKACVIGSIKVSGDMEFGTVVLSPEALSQHDVAQEIHHL